jgi:hypothetical protein
MNHPFELAIHGFENPDINLKVAIQGFQTSLRIRSDFGKFGHKTAESKRVSVKEEISIDLDIK